MTGVENDTAQARPHDTTHMWRSILAAVIGNGLEFYDFLVYAFFAIQIGQAFFPSDDPFLSLMGSLGAFGAGFVSRPLGAWVLGTYADRHGRKPAMLISMVMMGAGIALLALTPSYATIGLAAPVIAIAARLIQGFALGGEVGSSMTFLVEAAPPHRRGLVASLQGASQAIAATLGSTVGLVLSLMMGPAELASYGWRVALLLGTLIVPIALFLRRTMPETMGHGTVEEPSAGEPGRGLSPLVKRVVVLGTVIMGARAVTNYAFNYMATYGQSTLHLPAKAAMAGVLASNATYFVAAVLGGWLSDRYGRRRVMIVPMAFYLLLIVPCFAWLTEARTMGVFIAANVILATFNYLNNGPIYAAIAESLPARMRARGFSLIYSIPVSLLGGSTQLMVAWVLHATGNPMSVAWFLAAVCCAGLIATALMRESAPGLARVARAVG